MATEADIPETIAKEGEGTYLASGQFEPTVSQCSPVQVKTSEGELDQHPVTAKFFAEDESVQVGNKNDRFGTAEGSNFLASLSDPKVDKQEIPDKEDQLQRGKEFGFAEDAGIEDKEVVEESDRKDEQHVESHGTERDEHVGVISEEKESINESPQCAETEAKGSHEDVKGRDIGDGNAEYLEREVESPCIKHEENTQTKGEAVDIEEAKAGKEEDSEGFAVGDISYVEDIQAIEHSKLDATDREGETVTNISGQSELIKCELAAPLNLNPEENEAPTLSQNPKTITTAEEETQVIPEEKAVPSCGITEDEVPEEEVTKILKESEVAGVGESAILEPNENVETSEEILDISMAKYTDAIPVTEAYTKVTSNDEEDSPQALQKDEPSEELQHVLNVMPEETTPESSMENAEVITCKKEEKEVQNTLESPDKEKREETKSTDPEEENNTAVEEDNTVPETGEQALREIHTVAVPPQDFVDKKMNDETSTDSQACVEAAELSTDTEEKSLEEQAPRELPSSLIVEETKEIPKEEEEKEANAECNEPTEGTNMPQETKSETTGDITEPSKDSYASISEESQKTFAQSISSPSEVSEKEIEKNIQEDVPTVSSSDVSGVVTHVTSVREEETDTEQIENREIAPADTDIQADDHFNSNENLEKQILPTEDSPAAIITDENSLAVEDADVQAEEKFESKENVEEQIPTAADEGTFLKEAENEEQIKNTEIAPEDIYVQAEESFSSTENLEKQIPTTEGEEENKEQIKGADTISEEKSVGGDEKIELKENLEEEIPTAAGKGETFLEEAEAEKEEQFQKTEIAPEDIYVQAEESFSSNETLDKQILTTEDELEASLKEAEVEYKEEIKDAETIPEQKGLETICTDVSSSYVEDIDVQAKEGFESKEIPTETGEGETFLKESEAENEDQIENADVAPEDIFVQAEESFNPKLKSESQITTTEDEQGTDLKEAEAENKEQVKSPEIISEEKDMATILTGETSLDVEDSVVQEEENFESAKNLEQQIPTTEGEHETSLKYAEAENKEVENRDILSEEKGPETILTDERAVYEEDIDLPAEENLESTKRLDEHEQIPTTEDEPETSLKDAEAESEERVNNADIIPEEKGPTTILTDETPLDVEDRNAQAEENLEEQIPAAAEEGKTYLKEAEEEIKKQIESSEIIPDEKVLEPILTDKPSLEVEDINLQAEGKFESGKDLEEDIPSPALAPELFLMEAEAENKEQIKDSDIAPRDIGVQAKGNFNSEDEHQTSLKEAEAEKEQVESTEETSISTIVTDEKCLAVEDVDMHAEKKFESHENLEEQTPTTAADESEKFLKEAEEERKEQILQTGNIPEDKVPVTIVKDETSLAAEDSDVQEDENLEVQVPTAAGDEGETILKESDEKNKEQIMHTEIIPEQKGPETILTNERSLEVEHAEETFEPRNDSEEQTPTTTGEGETFLKEAEAVKEAEAESKDQKISDITSEDKGLATILTDAKALEIEDIGVQTGENFNSEEKLDKQIPTTAEEDETLLKVISTDEVALFSDGVYVAEENLSAKDSVDKQIPSATNEDEKKTTEESFQVQSLAEVDSKLGVEDESSKSEDHPNTKVEEVVDEPKITDRGFDEGEITEGNAALSTQEPIEEDAANLSQENEKETDKFERSEEIVGATEVKYEAEEENDDNGAVTVKETSANSNSEEGLPQALQTYEPVEGVEKLQDVMPEETKTESWSENAEDTTCTQVERAVQNIEESPDKKKKEEETDPINSNKENDTTEDEVLEIVSTEKEAGEQALHEIPAEDQTQTLNGREATEEISPENQVFTEAADLSTNIVEKNSEELEEEGKEAYAEREQPIQVTNMAEETNLQTLEDGSAEPKEDLCDITTTAETSEEMVNTSPVKYEESQEEDINNPDSATASKEEDRDEGIFPVKIPEGIDGNDCAEPTVKVTPQGEESLAQALEKYEPGEAVQVNTGDLANENEEEMKDSLAERTIEEMILQKEGHMEVGELDQGRIDVDSVDSQSTNTVLKDEFVADETLLEGTRDKQVETPSNILLPKEEEVQVQTDQNEYGTTTEGKIIEEEAKEIEVPAYGNGGDVVDARSAEETLLQKEDPVELKIPELAPEELDAGKTEGISNERSLEQIMHTEIIPEERGPETILTNERSLEVEHVEETFESRNDSEEHTPTPADEGEDVGVQTGEKFNLEEKLEKQIPTAATEDERLLKEAEAESSDKVENYSVPEERVISTDEVALVSGGVYVAEESFSAEDFVDKQIPAATGEDEKKTTEESFQVQSLAEVESNFGVEDDSSKSEDHPNTKVEEVVDEPKITDRGFDGGEITEGNAALSTQEPIEEDAANQSQENEKETEHFKETDKFAERSEEIVNASEVKFEAEGENAETSANSNSEEGLPQAPQTYEPVEGIEKLQDVMPEETKTESSSENAEDTTCTQVDRAFQNIEESPDKEKKEEETDHINSTKDDTTVDEVVEITSTEREAGEQALHEIPAADHQTQALNDREATEEISQKNQVFTEAADLSTSIVEMNSEELEEERKEANVECEQPVQETNTAEETTLETLEDSAEPKEDLCAPVSEEESSETLVKKSTLFPFEVSGKDGSVDLKEAEAENKEHAENIDLSVQEKGLATILKDGTSLEVAGEGEEKIGRESLYSDDTPAKVRDSELVEDKTVEQSFQLQSLEEAETKSTVEDESHESGEMSEEIVNTSPVKYKESQEGDISSPDSATASKEEDRDEEILPVKVPEGVDDNDCAEQTVKVLPQGEEEEIKDSLVEGTIEEISLQKEGQMEVGELDQGKIDVDSTRELRETSGTVSQSDSQSTDTVLKDELVADETLLEGTRDMQVETPSDILLPKEEELQVQTEGNIIEEEAKEMEVPAYGNGVDVVDARSAEETFLQKEDPVELKVSELAPEELDAGKPEGEIKDEIIAYQAIHEGISKEEVKITSSALLPEEKELKASEHEHEATIEDKNREEQFLEEKEIIPADKTTEDLFSARSAEEACLQEEETKETNAFELVSKSDSQVINAVPGDDIIADQILLEGTTDKQSQVPSYTLLAKEEEHGASLVDKSIEEAHGGDLFAAMSVEETILQKEEPEELKVSELAAEEACLQEEETKDPNAFELVSKSDSQIINSVPGDDIIADQILLEGTTDKQSQVPSYTLLAREEEHGATLVEKSIEEADGRDLFAERSVEETILQKEEPEEVKVSELAAEEVDAGETKEEIKEAFETVSKSDSQTTDVVSREDGVITYQTLDEGIPKEQLQIPSSVPLPEEKEINASEHEHETTTTHDQKIEENVSNLQTPDDERQLTCEDIGTTKDYDSLFITDKTMQDSVPEIERKSVEEVAIELGLKKQADEVSSESSITETRIEKDASIDISQKDIKGFEEGKEISEDIKKTEETAHPTSEKMEIPTEAYSNDSTETSIPTGKKDVQTTLQDLIVDDTKGTSDTFVAKDIKDGTSEASKERTQVTEEKVPTAASREVPTDGEEEEEQHENVEEVKTDEEKGDTDSPIMVEASRDVDAKVSPKKSHNILSGIKHSISKVKKAITGKSSSHSKTQSEK